MLTILYGTSWNTTQSHVIWYTEWHTKYSQMVSNRSGQWLYMWHVIPQLFESSHKMFGRCLWTPLITTQFIVRFMTLDHVVNDHQYWTGNCNNGAFLSTSPRHAVILRRQAGITSARGGMSSLDEARVQSFFAVSRRTRISFPRAFVVPGATQPRQPDGPHSERG